MDKPYISSHRFQAELTPWGGWCIFERGRYDRRRQKYCLHSDLGRDEATRLCRELNDVDLAPERRAELGDDWPTEYYAAGSEYQARYCRKPASGA